MQEKRITGVATRKTDSVEEFALKYKKQPNERWHFYKEDGGIKVCTQYTELALITRTFPASGGLYVVTFRLYWGIIQKKSHHIETSASRETRTLLNLSWTFLAAGLACPSELTHGFSLIYVRSSVNVDISS